MAGTRATKSQAHVQQRDVTGPPDGIPWAHVAKGIERNRPGVVTGNRPLPTRPSSKPTSKPVPRSRAR